MNTAQATFLDKQQEQAQDLIESFDMFESWEDKYHFIIDMGSELSPLPESEKIEVNRVHGCMSSVWLTAYAAHSPEGQLLHFNADSDSAIVKGLIAILHSLLSGYPAQVILAFDINAFMQKVGLNRHLSLNRKNGIQGMVKRIRALALKSV